MLNHSIQSSQLPETLEHALIIVLFKPGKDPKLCGSYRPFSLLSSEYKILTKVIATQLEKVIHTLVKMDQIGFI